MSLRSVFRAPTDARLHSLKPTHSTHPIHLFLLGRPQESGPAEECDRVPAYGAEAAEDCAARHGCEWRETRKGQGVFAPSLRRSQIGCVSSSPCSHSSTVSFAGVVVVLVRFEFRLILLVTGSVVEAASPHQGHGGEGVGGCGCIHAHDQAHVAAQVRNFLPNERNKWREDDSLALWLWWWWSCCSLVPQLNHSCTHTTHTLMSQ